MAYIEGTVSVAGEIVARGELSVVSGLRHVTYGDQSAPRFSAMRKFASTLLHE